MQSSVLPYIKEKVNDRCEHDFGEAPLVEGSDPFFGSAAKQQGTGQHEKAGVAQIEAGTKDGCSLQKKRWNFLDQGGSFFIDLHGKHRQGNVDAVDHENGENRKQADIVETDVVGRGGGGKADGCADGCFSVSQMKKQGRKRKNPKRENVVWTENAVGFFVAPDQKYQGTDGEDAPEEASGEFGLEAECFLVSHRNSLSGRWGTESCYYAIQQSPGQPRSGRSGLFSCL